MQRKERERGASLVEFTLIALLLFLLLFGIITFGLLLSFKQNLVESAADGARAGVFVPAGDSNPANGRDDRIDEALEELERSINAYDRSCAEAADGLTCSAIIADCDGVAGGPECLTVQVDFDNTGDSAYLPDIPLLRGLIPETMTAKSVVEVDL